MTVGRCIVASNVAIIVMHSVVCSKYTRGACTRVYTAAIKVHNASFEWRVYKQFSDISAFGTADATGNIFFRAMHACTHSRMYRIVTYRAYFQNDFKTKKYRQKENCALKLISSLLEIYRVLSRLKKRNISFIKIY